MAHSYSDDFHNNFGFIRLLLSSCVIISHSFPLTGREEIFGIWVNNQFDLGKIALNCFFILSGYLIYQSLCRSNTIRSYFWKRLIRIFPGLLVALLFTLFIVFLIYPKNNLLFNRDYLTYLPNCLSLYKVQYFIPSVFETNIFPKNINGSLWSLRYEFTLYIALMSIFWIRKMKILCFYILLTGFIVMYLLYNFREVFIDNHLIFLSSFGGDSFRLPMFFVMGTLLTFVDLSKFNSIITRILIVFTIIITIFFNVFNTIGIILLAPLLIMCGSLKTRGISLVDRKIGDLSYGLYVYGWFVQQTLMHYFDLTTVGLVFWSLLVTAVISYFSWHYVEKKAMTFKYLF